MNQDSQILIEWGVPICLGVFTIGLWVGTTVLVLTGAAMTALALAMAFLWDHVAPHPVDS